MIIDVFALNCLRIVVVNKGLDVHAAPVIGVGPLNGIQGIWVRAPRQTRFAHAISDLKGQIPLISVHQGEWLQEPFKGWIA